jgi:hypothetical protein
MANLIGEPLNQCGFTARRLDGALAHFHRLGYHSNVFLLVNDATAILPALSYCSNTDRAFGWAIPDDVLDDVDLRVGDSLDAYLARFHGQKLATQVEIYLLVPLAARIPPYILAVFAQAGSQTMEAIKQRLTIAQREMESRGALIIGWAADGATSHFKLMRERRTVSADAPSACIPAIPALPPSPTKLPADASVAAYTATVQLPSRTVQFANQTMAVTEVTVFDPVHLINLVLNSTQRKNAAMRIGNAQIRLLRLRDWLEERLGTAGMETTLGVRHSDFASEDRMNYAAAQRIFSCRLLKYVEDHGSQQFKGAQTHLLVVSE